MKKQALNPISEEVYQSIKTFKDEEDTLKVNYSVNDLRRFEPLTENQSILEELYLNQKNIICDGVAGVGKTFAALNLMLFDLLETETKYNQIVIVRSAVTTRDIGHLPGTEDEKMAAFEAPYQQICNELFSKDKSSDNYQALKNSGYIQFKSTSHIRGVTFRNKLILVDEVENMNYHEIKSVLTRVGEGSKIVLCGDYGQTDLIKSKNDKSGIQRLKLVAERMENLKTVTFDKNDIVRSGFVKDFYLAEIELEDEEIKELNKIKSKSK